MTRKIYLLLFMLLFLIDTNAQCAMCRAVLENEDGQGAAKGINDGIIYLMTIPYILVFGIGYIIYRTYSKSKKKE